MKSTGLEDKISPHTFKGSLVTKICDCFCGQLIKGQGTYRVIDETI